MAGEGAEVPQTGGAAEELPRGGRAEEEPHHLDDRLDAVLVGGRRPVTIVLAEPDPSWPERFEDARRRLAGALGGVARGIEHVGSTAVTGLAAKPIVDVLVEVDDPDDDAAHQPALEGIGLVLRVREPGHRMYRSPEGDLHVHLWRAGSEDVRRHVVFRDWLRRHPDDRDRYAAVKRGLADRQWPDMNYYAEAKSDVIADIMARAAGAGDGTRPV